MTVATLNRNLKLIAMELRGGDEQDVRRKYREEKGLVYVREYTVGAHFYTYRPRRRRTQ